MMKRWRSIVRSVTVALLTERYAQNLEVEAGRGHHSRSWPQRLTEWADSWDL